MSKTKLFIGLFVYLIIALAWTIGLFSARTVLASVLSIQTLPGYITSNNFKLSCTSDGNSAQFYYSKNGGSYTAFGPAIDLSANSCLVQVDSSVVNDQTNYAFKVNVDGTDSTSTTTFYDISGPSPVSGYYKEQAGTAFFKLHWKNPGDSDFSKVVIYRGEEAGFSADASHEISRVSGGINAEMTYDDHQPDANKTYFYAIRALDGAGNSSSLAGDSTSTTTTTGTPSASAGSASRAGTGSVVQLPSEGSILGDETTESPAPEDSLTPAADGDGTTAGFLEKAKGVNKYVLGAAGLVLIIAAYFFTKRGK